MANFVGMGESILLSSISGCMVLTLIIHCNISICIVVLGCFIFVFVL